MAVRVIETRPSGVSYWANCTAAPLFATLYKRPPPLPGEDDAANEGTCAAWVADEVIAADADLCSDMLGMAHPGNGWVVDDPMVTHIQGYVDMIRAEGGLISSERFVRLSDRVAGTLDNSAAMADGVLRVRDLKYGFKLIEAWADQLVIYAGALVAEILENGGVVREVWTEIYQPRGHHPDGIHRKHKWTVAELFERCNWLAMRAEECYKPNPVATPGPHCINCDAATGCVALAATTSNMVSLVQDTRYRDLSGAQLGARLTYIKEVKKTVDALAAAIETETLARRMGGEYIPDWGLKERTGHAKFKMPRDVVKAICGVDPVKTVEMSPAELRAAGVKKSVVDSMTWKPPIGHKLAKLDGAELARQFKKV